MRQRPFSIVIEHGTHFIEKHLTAALQIPRRLRFLRMSVRTAAPKAFKVSSMSPVLGWLGYCKDSTGDEFVAQRLVCYHYQIQIKQGLCLPLIQGQHSDRSCTQSRAK